MSEQLNEIADKQIWLKLAMLKQCGAVLSAAGAKGLKALSSKHPEWNLESEQNDDNVFQKYSATPRHLSLLTKWLISYESDESNISQENDWRHRCDEDFSTTSKALLDVAKKGIWPIRPWREALQVWSEEKHHQHSWNDVAPVISGISEEILQKLSRSVSWWLEAIARNIKEHDEQFFKLANCILKLEYQDSGDAEDSLHRSINHPVGLTTQALLNWWFGRGPLKDRKGIPSDLCPIFTSLCDTKIIKYRHGRVLLARYVITLFRMDSEWTSKNLLKVFDWKQSEREAHYAWEGFLGSPRLYRPLMAELKSSFLDTANYYDKLEMHIRQYSMLLTDAALDRNNIFTDSELREATHALPEDGLYAASQTLMRTIEGVDDNQQHIYYWNNRFAPYLINIWPKLGKENSLNFTKVTRWLIGENLGCTCVAAGEKFPAAFTLIKDWLVKSKRSKTLIDKLYEAGHCKKFPDESLNFLDMIIDDHTQLPDTELDNCLKEIKNANPELKNHKQYKRLQT